MRSLLLVLLLANLLLFATQFDVVRELVGDQPAPRPAPLNAEKLRVIRDTSLLPRTSPGTAQTSAAPPSPAPSSPGPAATEASTATGSALSR